MIRLKILNTANYEIKKSKFYAYFYEVEKKEEISIILTNLRKEHKKARHIPYAYFVNGISGKSDDKEPSNTAGTPIYTLLEKKELKSHAIFVVRYFGGIKLGAGGLFRSYLTAAKNVIE